MLKIIRKPLGLKHSGLILGSPSLDPEASPSLSRDASAGPEAMEIDVHGNGFFVYEMDFLCTYTKKPAHIRDDKMYRVMELSWSAGNLGLALI